jgi:hypothetical protein
MRKLRIVLRYLRLSWKHRTKRRPTEYPTPSVDSEEFSNLLRSGRKEDMETLAKRLSRRPRSPA